MQRRSILAVDPGLKTGVALLDRDKGATPEVTELDFIGTCRAIRSFVERHPDGIIVCESFITTARTAQLSNTDWSLELIGVCRYFATEYLDLDLILRTPAQAKAFGTDAKLKALNWYRPTKGGHQNDAQRHLMLYAAANGYLDLTQLVGVDK